jgi:ketosteroid isomerase-like protein
MPTAHRTDKRAILDLDARWGDAATRHDLDAVVAFYAPDATLVWPDMKAVHGAAAIRRAWKHMIAVTPGLGLTFVADTITVAKQGDLAADFGKVILTMDGKKGKKVREVAKYLVTWQKVRGTWMVLYDSWNTNTTES